MQIRQRPVAGGLDELKELWESGGSVHDRAGGAARAWMCPEGRIAAIFPDVRQASEFALDRKAFFPERPLFRIAELPLTLQTIGSRPLLLERGETIRRWTAEGGILVATPGALMSPCI
ncbi:hypothetical protein, partial [uncultured Fretibacterium sp.]|uniref:hypothetical protein n=1 Tax=uncultured Fretibacterium sp. TaxID=1678694 RepID=UPI0026097978